MPKKKSKGPNWANTAAAASAAPRPSTPATRAAESLSRAVAALLVTPGIDRLGEYAPIEVELRAADQNEAGGAAPTVHVVAAWAAGEVRPRELLVATGGSSFAQIVAWCWGLFDDGSDAGSVPAHLLPDADLLSIEVPRVRDLPPAFRRDLLGERLMLDGVPHGVMAVVETHRRAGLVPDAVELQLLTAVVEALTRALDEPSFRALPYDFEEQSCTRLAADGSFSEVPWPELDDDVFEALEAWWRRGDHWGDVDDRTRAALVGRACALPDADRDGAERALVVTGLRRSDAAPDEPDEPGVVVVLERGTLRELARREVPSSTQPGVTLAALLEAVLEVLEGSAAGGPNEWQGGLPGQLIVELEELERPLDELFVLARARADLSALYIELSAADQAAAHYLTALEQLGERSTPTEIDAALLSGSLAFIHHRSEHVEGGWEVELLAFLDDEKAEHRLLHGGLDEGRIAGAQAYRVLRAVVDCPGAAAWLPPLMGTAALPLAFARGFAAWAAATPDFFVREPDGETFRALAAGAAGVRVPEEVLDDLPDFDSVAEAVPLWRASLGAAEHFVPAGCPVSLALAHEILAAIQAEHGNQGDSARRASAGLLVRRTFVK